MYEKFDKINGEHPWRDVSPEGYVDYPVRYRKGGKVLYFNFNLAREMGLIPRNHPDSLNSKLEDAILRNFSIQIINEHDWMNKKSLPKDHLTDRLYMATRYLQLQHENKQGETSGDGRSIWNGIVKSRTKIFDVSSCGTGNTILSPGTIEAGKHIPTGSNEFGYASGLADVDEMLSGAVMSDIFYRQGFPTERCLAVIDYNDGTSIGVRTSPNLVRPAHIFRYLKMGKWEETKKSFDFFLERQEYNGVLNLTLTGQRRYANALKYLTKTYAKLAALMEEEYIFNWLAWDGDNILASGGILDYGSIRQFSAKHNKYRYDDVDRFSTCLSEQRYWTKKLIQTFVQAVDFIISKEKKNLDSFENDKYLEMFDKHFVVERQKRMLWRLGFTEDQADRLVANNQEDIEAFQKALHYFEDVKTAEGEQAVPDGINHPPVFLVRNILRELPIYLYRNYKKGKISFMPAEQFCLIMAASYVDDRDLKITDYRRQRVLEFQELYWELVRSVNKNKKQALKSVVQRSKVINYEFRSTGDGLTWIVNEAINARNRMKRQRLQKVVERFIKSQVLVPGKWKPIKAHELKGKSLQSRLLQKMMANLELYSETI